MASSKRPAYIAETKLVPERKRRKSDLVIMWQSVWGVTAIILQELWITLLKMWELVLIWFSTSERFEIQTWLEKYLPYVPDDFSDSWRDGRLLAILLNKLQPGCFPDANQLDPDYGLKNVYKAFDVLEVYFGIKPKVSVEEVVTCSDGSDSKLFEIMLELKRLTDTQPENKVPPEPETKENTEQLYVNQSCIAKGTGLAVGFVGRITTFIIFCAFMSDLDVVVEIRGPNTICSERITKRSPKKKRSLSTWEYPRHHIRSVSFNEEQDGLETEDEILQKKIIPLEYEVIGNQISMGYKPKEKGQHKVTILWHGQHVSDSPYFVTVEDSSEITATNNVIRLKSAMKTLNEGERDESRKNSVRFQESQVRYKEQSMLFGRVLSRKILRYIVRICGKDVPVNAENTESLAAELLKMEYDIETCPSSHRRNSWGFTGDAERKKSVIRQFGIDENELDAQICQRRTRSLSINSESKKLLEKSYSLDNMAPRLNIVNEKINENEDDYAYINEEVSTTSDGNEIKGNYVSALEDQIEREMETSKFSNVPSKSNSVEIPDEQPSCEMEFDEISSLSTDLTQVDNSNEDLTNIPPDALIPKLYQPSNKTTVTMSLNCEFPNKKLNNYDREWEKIDSGTSKILQPAFGKKIKKKVSRVKKYRREKNCIITCPQKMCKKTRIEKKSKKKKFDRREFTNTDSISVLPVKIIKNRYEKNRRILKPKEYISLKVLKRLKSKESMKLKNFTNENEIGKHLIDLQRSSSKNLNISDNFSIDDKPKRQNNSLSVKEWYIKNNEENKIPDVNHSFRNIIHHEESMHNYGTLDHMVQEPEIKKFHLKEYLNAIPLSSEIESKGANVVKSTVLRTHSLRAIGQFNFKQFNPPQEIQSTLSPVKSQIVQWESALSTENKNGSLRRTSTSETEQVSVKEKLAFWENTYKLEKKSSSERTLENNTKMNLLEKQKSFKSHQGNSNSMRNDLQGTGNKPSFTVSVSKEKREASNFINNETNMTVKKQIDDKMSPELQLNPKKIRRRSFSDPGVSEATINEAGDSSNITSLESSSKECLNSSNDDNWEQYFSDDSEDSSSCYTRHSAEDEYIDDEICERATEYWGDLSILKGLKTAQCANNYSISEDDFFLNHQQLVKSFPCECKVFGIAVYYGYVAVKNRFQVYTGDSGFGNLSASMQGFRQHDVSLVSVAYVRNHIYEVTYQVMTTGYYLVSIRWMDREIPGSPFVCKVTF